jgi:hypothetical protein
MPARYERAVAESIYPLIQALSNLARVVAAVISDLQAIRNLGYYTKCAPNTLLFNRSTVFGLQLLRPCIKYPSYVCYPNIERNGLQVLPFLPTALTKAPPATVGFLDKRFNHTFEIQAWAGTG